MTCRVRQNDRRRGKEGQEVCANLLPASNPPTPPPEAKLARNGREFGAMLERLRT